MVNSEVIDLLDSDGEDDVQVLYESNRESTAGSYTSVGRVNNNTARAVDFHGINNDNNHDYDDDDVQIVEERINVPERAASATPSFVIHAPGGPIPVYEGNESSVEPERRSFQNARGPAPPQIREQSVMSSRAEYLRRQEQQRIRNEIQTRQAQQRLAEQQQRAQARQRLRRSRRPQPAALANRVRPAHAPPLRTNRTPIFRMMLQMGAFNNLFFNDYDDDERDPTYYPGMMFPGQQEDNGVDQHIMNIIEEREIQEADKKRSINENATKPYHNQCNEKIKNIKAPFTTTIDPSENYVCILCGVTLGEGIPEDFRGNIVKTTLPKLQEAHDVQAPYEALNLVTDADRDLSKRVFISTCGHTYCGRCVKNISNVKGVLKEKKMKFKKTDNNIENPFVYAPSKCIGPDCGVGLCARRRFNEVFI